MPICTRFKAIEVKLKFSFQFFSGLGAGMDSFYEYLLKSHILFGDKDDLNMFNQLYGNIKTHLRKGTIHIYVST